jgi:DNA-binding response OmpR family regulator
MTGAILIVDSDPALAQWLHDRLAEFGHAVEVALHGGDALMLASLVRPDAVMMDADLCDRSGLDVLRELKELDASIAVVLLSAAVDQAFMRSARRLGALECLQKPVDLGVLRSAATLAVAAGRQHSPDAVVVPFRSDGTTPATPFDGAEQLCAACRAPVADLTRAVAYKRAVFHPECWLARRRQRTRG